VAEKGQIQMLRKATNHSLLFLVALLALLIAATACGGDDDDDDGGVDTSPPAAAVESTAPPEGPGTITLTSTAITGRSGLILVVFAQGNGQQVASLCAPITSDDFTLSASVMTEMPADDNPCEDGLAKRAFDEGSQSLTAGVYVPGEQIPQASTTVSVNVAGNVTAEIDGTALSQ
jgi:hypothetical protein